jgi:hypothetical protein
MLKNEKMKYRKRVLCVILFLNLGIIELQAQMQMSVKTKDGSQTIYSLTDISKLTFPKDSVLVNNLNATPQSFALSNIRYLSFANYSKTAVVEIETKHDSSIRLYPNPAKEEINIIYQAIQCGTVQIRIINLYGQTVLEQTHENTKGENNVRITISDLAAGLYLLSDGVESRSFIKI